MYKLKKLLVNKFGSGGTDMVSAKSSDHLNIQLQCSTGTRRIQNCILIWLDATIDEVNDKYWRNNITCLRGVFNEINTFTDSKQCNDFLNEITNEKVFMIISGTLGQSILPKIHDLRQVDSIYIFCMNKSAHERWAKDWLKIKGVFTEMSPLCEALQQASVECEQNSISFSFVLTKNNITDQNLHESELLFMYTQVLKEILLSIEFKQKDLKEFITYYQNLPDQKDFPPGLIDELKHRYNKKTCIGWYTRESPLYSTLNQALRKMEIDTIIRMGFFIRDLHEQIQQLHSTQFVNQHSMESFIVYRGQMLSINDFQRMIQAKQGLMSFNNFLSTSTDRNVSLKFAQANSQDPNKIRVLFVMTINPSISATPFASISAISCYTTENEILFSMHTVFRIDNIEQSTEDKRLWEVKLIQIRENDKDICALTKRIQDETRGFTGWDRLGRLFIKLGQSDKAQHMYETLLKTASDDSDKSNYYNQLGWTNDNQGQYEMAISFYKKALAIMLKANPQDQENLASAYNNIGVVYNRMGDYSNALLFFEKALKHRQKIYHLNHPELAHTYNNLGLAYKKTHDFPQALSCLKKALEIRMKGPANHPDLAESYNNLGLLYEEMNENEEAYLCHKHALEIRQRSLPANHPNIFKSLSCLKSISSKTGNQAKLIPYNEETIDNKKTLIKIEFL